jgi:GUN4-like/ARM-like repeat domain, GUN4-N terminal
LPYAILLLSMTNSAAETDLATFQQKFAAANPKNQLQMLGDLDSADPQVLEFLQSLLAGLSGWPTVVQGKAYQLLYDSPLAIGTDFLSQEFPTGIVPLKSEAGVDYQELQRLLANREWQAADKLTNLKLCELAGPIALQRQWLYFTDVQSMPILDLQTIDRLWYVHSEGQFGFAVQRSLWLAAKQDWEKLWPKIGWKDGNNWTRYPGSFTWSLSAPPGHLPLFNQLRGVRTIAALMNHPIWQSNLEK